jgi:hypothetical protein
MLTTGKKTSLGGVRRVRKYAKERAVKRCPFVASAEVVEVGTGTKLSARTSEIGVGGCYVDALNPFHVGTAVTLKIVRDQGAFVAKAKVVYSDATDDFRKLGSRDRVGRACRVAPWKVPDI